MSYTTDIRTNLAQNQPNFQLPPIEQEPIIFKRGYFIKELDPIQENPSLPRTIIVKCTYKNCKYVFILFYFNLFINFINLFIIKSFINNEYFIVLVTI